MTDLFSLQSAKSECPGPVLTRLSMVGAKTANLTMSELAMYSRAGQAFAKLTDKELTALSAKRGWRELEI
ncbi:MAG TPA: hypothetical protein VIZ19_20120 [Roseiarcus sp.]